MIKFNLRNIASIIDAVLIGHDRVIMSISIDSRTIIKDSNCLFIALKGKNFDAHDFATEAVINGADALLVNLWLPIDVPQLIVADTRLAISKLGAWVRQQVNTKIVALTGSSGKTSVKEMTSVILRQCGRVLFTKNNFNNDIGVSLTLLRLTLECDFAVFELGANHQDEIAWTSSLVRPEAVLINNISIAHLEGFGSLLGIVRAKEEIFTGLMPNGRVIFNNDSYGRFFSKIKIKNKSIWRFSIQHSEGMDFFASNIINTKKNVSFTLHSPQGECRIQWNLQGYHNIANALGAAALALAVGATLPAVVVGLTGLQSIPGRLFPISLGKNKLLLDDSYNSNFGSMNAAIRVLTKMPGYQVMVVGDINELGNQEIEFHNKIGRIISISSINKVLSVGYLSRFISYTSGCGEHFSDKKDLIIRLIELLSSYSIITILVKGSRSAKMERIIHELQKKYYVSMVS